MPLTKYSPAVDYADAVADGGESRKEAVRLLVEWWNDEEFDRVYADVPGCRTHWLLSLANKISRRVPDIAFYDFIEELGDAFLDSPRKLP